MSLFNELNNLMVEFYFKPNRKFGQNFLIDEKLIQKMAELGEISEKDTVLEIGAGTGFLTRELLKKAKKVIAVEFDQALIPVLERLKNEKLEIVNKSFLSLELPAFNKIVSSPPYMHSSEIMEKILFSDFEIAVLLFQKEFIEKMLAFPGFKEYNDLTVLVNYFCEAKSFKTISPHSFFPKPNSFSSIIILKKRLPHGKVKHEKKFYFFLKTIFRYKNKGLENSLKNSFPFLSKEFSLNKQEFFQKTHSLNQKKSKVCQLDCREFVEVFNELF